MGRPRQYPVGTPATVRVNASVARLKTFGGARKTWRLSPEAHSALRVIVEATHAATETEIIEWLLLERAAELRQSGSGPAPAPDRIYLYVPFKERHQADEAGAQWDRTVGKWYVTGKTDSGAVDRWREPATVMDAERSFSAECEAAGLVLPAVPVLDGAWHSCLVAGGKKNEPGGSYKASFEVREGRGFGIIQNSALPELTRPWRFDGGGPALPRPKKSGQVKATAKAKPSRAKCATAASLPDLSPRELEALLSAHVDLSAISPPTKRKAKAGG